MANKTSEPIQGMFLLVDRKSDDGLARWADELERRQIPALILADGHTLTKNPDLFKDITDRRFDIGCSYNDGALWSETYDDVITWLPYWLNIEKPQLKSHYDIQNTIIHTLNDKLTSITGRTMVTFSGKYFSYDEHTLRIAEEMEIPYILARGSQKARAVFYQPREYRPTIVSVSNVPSKQLGTGSLCDESLEARNETPGAFQKLLFDLHEDRMILVAQTHVSGLHKEWWDVYMAYFDSHKVHWQSLQDFVVAPQIMATKDIPVNKRADYMKLNLAKAKIAGEMV